MQYGIKTVVSADVISAQRVSCGDLIYCTDIDTIYLFDGNQRIAVGAAPLPDEPLVAAEPPQHYSNVVSRCPQCGAPHNEQDQQCPYCGSYFVAASAVYPSPFGNLHPAEIPTRLHTV